MDLTELVLLSAGLAMDAFAISICKGLAVKKTTLKNMLTVGLWFGIFQAAMPLIGYLAGYYLYSYISNIDHWIAFILLGAIGVNMLREALKKDDDCCEDGSDSLKLKEMFVLAVATSIDALAVGITFAFLSVDILTAVSLIGVITFTLSAVGFKLGGIFGAKFKSKAEFAGGLVLILLGAKILAEHMGII